MELLECINQLLIVDMSWVGKELLVQKPSPKLGCVLYLTHDEGAGCTVISLHPAKPAWHRGHPRLGPFLSGFPWKRDSWRRQNRQRLSKLEARLSFWCFPGSAHSSPLPSVLLLHIRCQSKPDKIRFCWKVLHGLRLDRSLCSRILGTSARFLAVVVTQRWEATMPQPWECNRWLSI